MKAILIAIVFGLACFHIGFHQGMKSAPAPTPAPAPTVIHEHRKADWIYQPSKSRLDEPPRSTKSSGYKSPLEQPTR